MSQERYYRDGKVGVLISPGYGANWSTYRQSRDEIEYLLFDPTLIQLVIDGNWERAGELAASRLPGFYSGGACQLEVRWLLPGTPFEVNEYDGFESLCVNPAPPFVA